MPSTKNPHCAGVASEELDEISPAHDDGTLLVTFDPLDGSSNIDINMTVGTIFLFCRISVWVAKPPKPTFTKRYFTIGSRLFYLWYQYHAGNDAGARCCHV